MPIRFVPFTLDLAAAVEAFNRRLSAAIAPPFLLPTAPAPADPPEASIRKQQFLAMDGDVCRGGYLRVLLPAWLNGERVEVCNVQAPLSEGLADRKYAMVAPLLFQHLRKEQPYSFAVGMGAITNAWPRTLVAARWTVEPVPFLFRVRRAMRFARQMQPLGATPVRRAAVLAAMLTGLGQLGLTVTQRVRVNTSGYRIVPAPAWGPWAEPLRVPLPGIRFSIARDPQMLDEVFPASEPRLRAYQVQRGGRVVGWSACLLTPMRGDRYFGDLTVGTILEAAGAESDAGAIVRLTDNELARAGAELVISNQSAPVWQAAFRAAGFLRYTSNYQFGASPALAAALSPHPVADGLVSITRADGDGRLHL